MIHQQLYSKMLLTTFQDEPFPVALWRDVTDFQHGDTLNIPTIGQRVVQDVEEDVDIQFTPIDNGRVNLTITDRKGIGTYVTDDLKEDGLIDVPMYLARNAVEEARAINKDFESRFFEVCNTSQTAADPNNINSFARRKLATGTNSTMSEDDLIEMGLAFDKAEVTQGGRVAIVSPVVARTLEKLVTRVKSDVASLAANPLNEMLRQNGFAKNHRFVTDLYGWNIWTSNRLDTLAGGASVDGTNNAPAEGADLNVFMCVADDNCKPIMAAWRRQPKSEFFRNTNKARS
jgi:hypothetical protein